MATFHSTARFICSDEGALLCKRLGCWRLSFLWRSAMGGEAANIVKEEKEVVFVRLVR